METRSTRPRRGPREWPAYLWVLVVWVLVDLVLLLALLAAAGDAQQVGS